MTSPDPSPLSAPTADDESTGLPGLRTWPLVYLAVILCFAMWVGLLIGLERFFS